ncbi:MAG TPA: cupin domain-containing protein [Thermoanaerobaculia bacterium]|nr:cupin domain-containing protein [Thermoanaerobaculia bacterium]
MIILDGGVRVSELKEGPATREGPLRIWTRVGRDSGARAISLRVLELDGGATASIRNDACDEVLYAIEGIGVATIDGQRFDLAPDTGIYAAPGTALTLANGSAAPMTLVSSRCPEPGAELPGYLPGSRVAGAKPVVALHERPIQRTGDRWYREILNEDAGSTQVTQFVGSIPPGRAPDHFHKYEEVICILRGHGVMWAGASSTPIAPGSCIFLPYGQTHCLENRGDGEMHLLGVFYPAGSPAVRYSG